MGIALELPSENSEGRWWYWARSNWRWCKVTQRIQSFLPNETVRVTLPSSSANSDDCAHRPYPPPPPTSPPPFLAVSSGGNPQSWGSEQQNCMMQHKNKNGFKSSSSSCKYFRGEHLISRGDWWTGWLQSNSIYDVDDRDDVDGDVDDDDVDNARLSANPHQRVIDAA